MMLPLRTMRNIGATLDETMSMADHISAVCKTANFELRNKERIRKYINVTSALKPDWIL